MKLITLNTWGGRVGQPLIEFIKAKSADTDFFCLQEVYFEAKGKEIKGQYRNDNLNLFGELSSILENTHTGYFNPALGDYYGLATFVRKDIDSEERGEIIVFDGVSGDYDKHPRNLQYTKIGDILICNIHGLWNGQGKTDTPDRLEQSRRVISFLNSRPEKKILCGDFNLEPDTESIKLLEGGLINLVKKYGVKSTRSSYYDKPVKFADYILVSPDLIVNSFEVLPDEVSDHLALQLDFE